MNCIKDARAPLIEGAAISTVYNGEQSAKEPPPKPAMIKNVIFVVNLEYK